MGRLRWWLGDQRGKCGPGYVSNITGLDQGDGDQQRRDVTEFTISFEGQWPNHEKQLDMMRRENGDVEIFDSERFDKPFFKNEKQGKLQQRGEWEETRVSTVHEAVGSPDWNLQKSRPGAVRTLRNILKENPQNRLVLAPGNASSPAAHERPLATREGPLLPALGPLQSLFAPLLPKEKDTELGRGGKPESDPCRGNCLCKQDVTSFRRVRRIPLPSSV